MTTTAESKVTTRPETFSAPVAMASKAHVNRRNVPTPGRTLFAVPETLESSRD
jgi:hypothetical protein